ncbi:hypothetical protein ABH940_006843 [Streptacidiphilus sp. BW17]
MEASAYAAGVASSMPPSKPRRNSEANRATWSAWELHQLARRRFLARLPLVLAGVSPIVVQDVLRDVGRVTRRLTGFQRARGLRCGFPLFPLPGATVAVRLGLAAPATPLPGPPPLPTGLPARDRLPAPLANRRPGRSASLHLIHEPRVSARVPTSSRARRNDELSPQRRRPVHAHRRADGVMAGDALRSHSIERSTKDQGPPWARRRAPSPDRSRRGANRLVGQSRQAGLSACGDAPVSIVAGPLTLCCGAVTALAWAIVCVKVVAATSDRVCPGAGPDRSPPDAGRQHRK